MTHTDATHSDVTRIHAPTHVAEVRDVVREQIDTATPMQIVGAGTWHGCGAPTSAACMLSLHALTGIVEYVPGDLTITALAGTSLAELSHATAAHGQWLGLDPAGTRSGTIGATIATASSGPLAHAFGTPRDQVLGLEAVTGYGDVVKPGGRVVKNVAGFDLVRLYTGAWGTLGPITSVTLRLRALPVHDVTLVMPIPEPALLAPRIAALRDSTVSLLAAEWIDGGTAAALGVTSGDDAIVLRLGGNDKFVRGQRAVLDRIAPNAPCDPSVWGALAMLDGDHPAVVRFAGAVSNLPARIARLRSAMEAERVESSLHAGIGRGTIRVIVRESGDGARGVMQHQHGGERRLVERLPASWWMSEHDPFAGGLASRIRSAFDPHLLCNRRTTTDA